MKKVYLIAVVIALIAGFATYMFASEIEKKTTIKDAETTDVYIALQDIAANTTITEEMFAEDAGYFELKNIISTDAAPSTAKTKDQLVNMVTIDKLYAGEQVSINRLQPLDGNDVALSLKLADGMVAYSLDAPTVTSVDGYINEGDTVDVLVSKENEDGEFESEVAYSDLKILRISTRSANKTANANDTAITDYNSLTVEVTEEQAMQLYDIENNYDFKLILNKKG